ncbi:hypothetical protein [Gluconobacter oxydans]|uniref:hypothetical protein n=1 Tax=Gluconobacter oxydans TaxID=442 RepID=UPI001559C0A2|nr:hypothetical protein [Gluconobacter oxydans]
MENKSNTINIIIAAFMVIYTWYKPESLWQDIMQIPKHPILSSAIIALIYLSITSNWCRINNSEIYINKLEEEINSLKQEVKELKDKNAHEW